MKRFHLGTRQRKQSKIGSFIVPFLSFFFMLYFGFHAFHGQYGLKSRYRLESQIETLHKKLKEVQTKRESLEHRVQLLRDGTLEKDILDEQARKALGVLLMDEVRIMIPSLEKENVKDSMF